MAVSAVACAVLVALIIAVTLAISRRSFTHFGHLVVDLGVSAVVVLLAAEAAIVLPMVWAVRSGAWRSLPLAVSCGVLTGALAFAIRYYLLRSPEDPGDVSAYVAFLWKNPWEFAGIAPFLIGGVFFSVYWRRSR